MVNTSEKDMDALLEQVHSLHKKAVAGNTNAVQDTHQLLEQLRSNYPNQPILDAYHGSTMLLIARDETKPLDKLRWAQTGLELLDEAVNADPHNTVIRLIRGKSSFRLPEKHFQRAQTTIEDYTFVMDEERRGNGFLDKQLYWQLMYELGELHYKIDQKQTAIDYWKRLKQETSNADFQRLLHLKLMQIEGKEYVDPDPTPEMKSPISILISKAARATGNELQYWAEQRKLAKEERAEEEEPGPRNYIRKRRKKRWSY
ncbi:hypothetical protein [Gracilibacillus xinjiangensis]|uniref:Tetratricopeptide repeat protein n=1 Tax=Gracilibacillus xinjiangensis TaxID=1193282 RepID=A0ABV8WRF3_9BACI